MAMPRLFSKMSEFQRAICCSARAAAALNRYLRYDAGLGGRVRELAILITARELDSQFEWAAHEQSSTGSIRTGSTPPTRS
jgi:alkylhydroperoxidase family enzyme